MKDSEYYTSRLQGEINTLIEGIKENNEEKRKRKEAKMRRCTDGLRQKNMSKNLGYTTIGAPKDISLASNSYITKTRIDPPQPTALPSYYPTYIFSNYSQTKPPLSIRKETRQPLTEVKSFMEEDEEEVSVAFEELMSEIAKYEEGDKRIKSERQ